ncbi:TPA: glycosyltransferase [Escherichia coli]
MSILTRWLLIPPVNARLIGRYRDYRRHGASAFSATLGCFWMILAWIFIPLEHPRWQRIRAEHKNLYPHINASRPRPLDPVRYLIQTCWLLIGASRKETPKPRRRAFSGLQNIRGRYHQWMNELPERVSHKTQHLDEKKELGHLSAGARRLILGIIVTFSLILALICVTQPFNPLAQFIFLMLLWGVALIVRRMPGRFSALMLIVLSLTVSCRYIWWRYTSTLNWDDPVSLVCGLILLFAETYAWIVLVLGYFQVVWPLNRQPVPLPKDMSLWPSVDIFVPTYNEDLNVVKNTIYASLGIDWPKDKLNIWILDDGGREEFRQFAQNVGVKYIARTTHEHAKAGNINNALKYAKGEFVSIFDCDHVPTRSFLQMTMGWFLKEKQLAMMQTPHHFFSPDPFERNLGRFRKTPNEGTLFYGLVQDGNDMWDATFFCGSCAVIRRKPLDEIGGIAVETVTEDAHTSLRLHRRGYTSAYMRIPQAAGLATESWVKTPMRQTPFPGIVPDESDRAAETQSTLTSSGAMAAVIGFQSPYNDQRSVIALLADSPRGYEMLNDAVNDSGKRATMFGSVAVIRESGINSLRVGDVYYVGHLPWFERLWYALANHPILLAVLAAISVILLAWVLWRLLRIISRRRLNPDNE